MGCNLRAAASPGYRAFGRSRNGFRGMLSELFIRDIVLIKRLSLSFEDGLTALTGETGAGKSILLDSLLLATGARADRAMVRSGADSGQVVATFQIDSLHRVLAELQEEGVETGDDLILRRQIKTDGKSRAWINDQPVSQTLLARIGAQLLEIHGQHDDRGILHPKAHLDLLDSYAAHGALVKAVALSYSRWQGAVAACKALQADLDAAKAEEDYIRHAVDELRALEPQPGEETQLAEARAAMMQGEKLASSLAEVEGQLFRDAGLDGEIRSVARKLDRFDDAARAIVQPAIEALDRAAHEIEAAGQAFENAKRSLDFDPARQEETESRLFELRRLARKHDCFADDLAAVAEQMEQQLSALDSGSENLVQLKAAEKEARIAFEAACHDLAESRAQAGAQLDAAVMAELPPLKMEAATFRTVITPLDAERWSATGAEVVHFEVQTNPGSSFGPLTKIASGGELSRFILALKVALTKGKSAVTMVFDEVDRGIGGATAAAVGERLERLAEGGQVLLVTHSPQVAARAAQQYQIQKTQTEGHTTTSLRILTKAERQEEIARMLAGAEITAAAREAAADLLA